MVLGTDELLIMGFESTVGFRLALGSGYTAAQFLDVEQGVYERDAWKQTARGRIYQGSYNLRRVTLPEQ